MTNFVLIRTRRSCCFTDIKKISLLNLFFVECVSWENSFSNTVTASQGDTATLKFKFDYGDDEANTETTTIKCGYIKMSDLTMETVIEKVGNSETTLVTGGKLGDRVSVFKSDEDAMVLGITITGVSQSDPTYYRCKAMYEIESGIESADSDLKTLVISS